jgi:hypothetical protein
MYVYLYTVGGEGVQILIQLSAEDRTTLQILYTDAFVVYAFDESKLNFRQQKQNWSSKSHVAAAPK